MARATLMNDAGLPRIVYIAGSGRSGSTLVDLLLGNQPDAFGAGELSVFFEDWLEGKHCTCGQAYPECPFWGNVIQRWQSALPGVTPEKAAQVTRRVEPLAGPWSAADRALYGQVWRTLLLAMHAENHKDVVVDSSKSSRSTWRRIHALGTFCGCQVDVIHLVRDPRALMWSAMRGSNRLLEAGQRGALRGGIYRMLVSWNLSNLSVHLLQSAGSPPRVSRLRYEDLVADPARALGGLGTFLNLDLTSVIATVQSRGPLDAGHGVGGNRMRRQGPVQITADEEWKRALPQYARWLTALSWPLAHQYGYELL